jgi:hypothetical protein
MIKDEDYVTVECVLHSEVLREAAKVLVNSEVEAKVGPLVDQVWKQVRRDALIGTFTEFNAELFGHGSLAYDDLQKTADAAAQINPEFGAADLGAGVLPFTLKLQAKWFKEPRIGLQQLIHVLCGDIFSRAVSDLRASIEVKRVSLGALENHFFGHYRRTRSYDIKAIRRLFVLDDAKLRYAPGKKANLPLLAFSFKPRNGLNPAQFKRIALGVLAAGFNLVEVDVRNIDAFAEDPAWRTTFGEIAQQATQQATHIARFSLNLSGPADLAIQYAEVHKALHPKGGPWVVKVDGGLDGLSTIQALRTHFAADEQPIITCYPILGGPLQRMIGADTFRDMLVLSGADIIYPGGAPRFGAGDFIDRERDEKGIRRYQEMLTRGWPMPSVAGGIHAGQLPGYFEIFNPDVCYFLGGGVAGHLNGAFFDTLPTNPNHDAKAPVMGKPIKPDQAVGGAELCRFAIEAAALADDFGKLESMLALTRDHYVRDNPSDPKYQFVNPKKILVGDIRSFRGLK